MQEKVVFDTNIYIGIFNKNLYRNEINGFNKIMYLLHPVLHELWIGAKGKREIRHLSVFGAAFIRLGRLVAPSVSTQVLIGKVCQKLRSIGKLDPRLPRIYSDICIAALTRQIGATLVIQNLSDFNAIQEFMDFKCRNPL